MVSMLQPPLAVNFKDRRQVIVQAYDEETGKYYVVTDMFSDTRAIYLYDAKSDKSSITSRCLRTRTSTPAASCSAATSRTSANCWASVIWPPIRKCTGSIRR